MSWSRGDRQFGLPITTLTKPLLGRSAEHGTLPILFAATSPDAATGVPLGPSRRKRDLRVHLAPIVAPGDDQAAARRLWSLSERLTGVTYLAPDGHDTQLDDVTS